MPRFFPSQSILPRTEGYSLDTIDKVVTDLIENVSFTSPSVSNVDKIFFLAESSDDKQLALDRTITVPAVWAVRGTAAQLTLGVGP